MAQQQPKFWTVEDFFAWQVKQDVRYELVNGFPLQMMAGTKNVHDDIVVNILLAIGNQLRGSGCRPFTGDGSVETYPGQIRRPDIGVDCGKRDPNGYKADSPCLIVEVLSPSTRDFDTFAKLAEYKLVPTLQRILFVEPLFAEVTGWRRESGGDWTQDVAAGLDASIAMPEIGATLKMSEIYEGVEFPANPRLMLIGQP